MTAAAPSEDCKTPTSRKTLPADQALKIMAEKAVMPLMSKEEGERLVSQLPKRSLAEALEMKERMIGRL